MIKNYVLTVIGDDRPGLIDSLAVVIKKHGGNWLESRLANLAGKFSGIVLVAIPAENADAFEQASTALKDNGLSVRATSTEGSYDRLRHKEWMTILANDRPGILSGVSTILAKLHVNVEELTTDCTPAPMSNEMLFKAVARISMPNDLTDDQLSEALEDLADDVVVELGKN